MLRPDDRGELLGEHLLHHHQPGRGRERQQPFSHRRGDIGHRHRRFQRQTGQLAGGIRGRDLHDRYLLHAVIPLLVQVSWWTPEPCQHGTARGGITTSLQQAPGQPRRRTTPTVTASRDTESPPGRLRVRAAPVEAARRRSRTRRFGHCRRDRPSGGGRHIGNARAVRRPSGIGHGSRTSSRSAESGTHGAWRMRSEAHERVFEDMRYRRLKATFQGILVGASARPRPTAAARSPIRVQGRLITWVRYAAMPARSHTGRMTTAALPAICPAERSRIASGTCSRSTVRSMTGTTEPLAR